VLVRLPLRLTDRDSTIDHALLQAWQGHIKEGFQQNSRMFTKVLSAFMIPYWITVVCYVILFAFGVIGFAVAAFLAVQQQLAFAAIFGGMSVATFLTFFISRPLRSLEQNLLFITWLGVIYNTYWTQLMNAVDPRTVRDDIQQINRQAVGDLDRLARRQKNAPAEPVTKGEGEPEHA
jgi:ABC-type multidrug transport system fused ATPase/permease subunit